MLANPINANFLVINLNTIIKNFFNILNKIENSQ